MTMNRNLALKSLLKPKLKPRGTRRPNSQTRSKRAASRMNRRNKRTAGESNRTEASWIKAWLAIETFCKKRRESRR